MEKQTTMNEISGEHCHCVLANWQTPTHLDVCVDRHKCVMAKRKRARN